MDKILKELEDSEVPDTSDRKGEVTMKLKQNVITKFESFLFNNISDEITGGESVRKLFDSFHEDVFKVRQDIPKK